MYLVNIADQNSLCSQGAEFNETLDEKEVEHRSFVNDDCLFHLGISSHLSGCWRS
jgi:hypothetical protein